MELVHSSPRPYTLVYAQCYQQNGSFRAFSEYSKNVLTHCVSDGKLEISCECGEFLHILVLVLEHMGSQDKALTLYKKKSPSRR